MKNIRREKYLAKIRPYIGKNLIKTLVGQRRVGKSYLLKQIKDEIKTSDTDANIIEIDLEKFEFRKLKTAETLFDYIQSKSDSRKLNYLFIDEIQEVENFEEVLRDFQSKENFDIYCTGSNAQLLSSEFATFLAGRQIEITIHPLSYKEFLIFRKLESSKKNLTRYMTEGGMPYLFNLPQNDEIIHEYLTNLLNTIFFRDIATRYKIRDTQFLQNLVTFLADNVGSLISATKISKYLKSQGIKKTPHLIIDYLEYINNSFLVRKTKKYDIQGKKIFESGEKYYFEDVGIRNTITGYRPTDINKVIENLVFNHLNYNDYKVFVGTMNHSEIDFVAIKKSETKYIQVAYKIENEQTRKREFENLIKIKDNYPKILITFEDIDFPSTYKGIEQYSLKKFLETEI